MSTGDVGLIEARGALLQGWSLAKRPSRGLLLLLLRGIELAMYQSSVQRCRCSRRVGCRPAERT